MKHIKNFKSFQSVNEELIAGLGVLAVAGLALAGSAVYDKARRLWSKHITGSKYTPTAKQEKVKNVETGKEETLSEYKDSDGNLYWGYDHLYTPDSIEGANLALYRAIFGVEDKSRLIKYLQGIKVQTAKPEYDYLDRPEPVDMIFLKDDYDYGSA